MAFADRADQGWGDEYTAALEVRDLQDNPPVRAVENLEIQERDRLAKWLPVAFDLLERMPDDDPRKTRATEEFFSKDLRYRYLSQVWPEPRATTCKDCGRASEGGLTPCLECAPYVA